MSILKIKQSGSTTLINLSQAVTVSTYTASKSVLYFSFKGGDGQADRSMVRGVKTNSTTITFYRNNDLGTTPTIEWTLLQFDADTDVQDIDESGTGTADTTITAVDTSKAFVVSNGVTCADDTLSDTQSALLQLTSSTNVRRITGTTGTAGTFAYQVIEQAGTHGAKSVQFFSLAAQTGTSFSQTITSVSTDRTILFGSAKKNGSGYYYSDVFRLSLASATSVTGNRAGTGSFDVGFYVVEYDTNVKVQRGSTAVGTSTDVTLSTIVVANAVAQMAAAHSCGFALGSNSDSTGDGTNANTLAAITSATNVNLSRTGTTGTNTVNWQVMEADPTAVSNILINDTPTTSSTTSDSLNFNHTLGGNTYRILIVCVTTRGNTTADTAVSCSFNSVAMTQGATATSGTSFNVRSTIFYLLDSSLPAAGTYAVDVTTPTGSPQVITAVAFSIRGAMQQSPEASYANGADASIQYVDHRVTTVTNNALTIDSFCGDGSGSAVPGTGQTERADFGSTNNLHLVSTRETGLAGESWPSMWSISSSQNRWSHAILAFEQAPTGQVESCVGSSAGTSSVSGGVNVDRALASQSNGVASVGAMLLVEKLLAASSAGIATVEGTLSSPVRLEASSNGVAAVSATLDSSIVLSGQSDGTSTVSADLRMPVWFTGQSDGSSSIVADVDNFHHLASVVNGVATVTGFLDTFFSGRSDGFSTVEGTLTVLKALQSHISTGATVTGTLQHQGAMNAASHGVSTVLGAITVTRAITLLTGSSAGQSTVVGDGSLLRVLTRLLAGVPGQASVTGTLTGARPYEGHSDGVATVSGTLDVQTALVAASAGLSAVAGAISVLIELAGGSNCWADVQGSLYGAIKLMTAVVNGQATVSGSLTVAARRLAGASAGVATAQGALLVQTSLAGLVEGLAAVDADLAVLRQVAGASNGVSTVVGTLAITRGLVATVAAVASVTGSTDVTKVLQAAVAGVATVAASLDADVPVAGASTGIAYVSGVLNVLRALEGAAAGQADVDSFLNRLRPIAGQIDGLTTVDADMLNIVWHEGQSDGVALVSASLQVQKALEAVSNGQSAPSGALWVAKALLASSLGLSHPVATLNVDGLGLGPTLSRGRARVRGSLTVIRFTSSTSAKDDPRIITRTIP